MSDGWVRVEDGLPDEGRWVWVAKRGAKPVLLGTRRGDALVMYAQPLQAAPWALVTHWRYAEVPEPPEEGA